MERVPTSLQFAVEGLQIFLSVVELSELVVCFSLKFFDVLYHRVQYMLSASRQEQNVFGEISFFLGGGCILVTVKGTLLTDLSCQP